MPDVILCYIRHVQRIEIKMTHKINDLSIKILAKLSNNCMEPNNRIAEKLGVTGSGVKKKMVLLMENRTIEGFSVKIQPHAFGYSSMYIVVPDMIVDDVVRQILSTTEVNSVMPCIDEMTVIGIVVKSRMQKNELIHEMTKYARILFISEVKDPYIKKTKTCLKILDEMSRDPRRQSRIIAKNIRIATKDVNYHIRQFHQCDGIQFTVRLDPTKMGAFAPHIIFIQMRGGFDRTIKDIDEMFKERYLEVPLIAEDQMMLFAYANIFEMDDMKQKVRDMQNVRSVDTFIPKKISFDHKWLKK